MTEEFVSEVKQIPHYDERIFTMLSDLSNLERIKDRIPQDKIKNFEFDSDTCSFAVDPVGKITFQIVEREPNKLITVRADLNPFLKPMVSKPLQEAVDKISTVIASLPY